MVYIIIIIGSCALMAIPGVSGYYSKVVIIEVSNYTYDFNTYFKYYMSLGAAFCTSFYITKLVLFFIVLMVVYMYT